MMEADVVESVIVNLLECVKSPFRAFWDWTGGQSLRATGIQSPLLQKYVKANPRIDQQARGNAIIHALTTHRQHAQAMLERRADPQAQVDVLSKGCTAERPHFMGVEIMLPVHANQSGTPECHIDHLIFPYWEQN